MPLSPRYALPSALLLLTLLPAKGCGDAAAQTPVEVTPACASEVRDGWQSSPWQSDDANCVYLPFQGQTTYRFFHTLGETPLSVDLYVSFTAEGTSVAPPAGDMSRILEVNDAYVDIRNQTNEDFFVRVVLR